MIPPNGGMLGYQSRTDVPLRPGQVDGKHTLSPICAPDASADEKPLAEGYERTRVHIAQLEGQTLEGTKRVLVVHSESS